MSRISLLLIFLFVSPVFAEFETVETPLGGLNTHDPSWRISSKFSPYMRNVFIDNGNIQGINGFKTLGSTNTLTKVTGIFPFNQESGASSFLVTDSSVTLETSDFVNYTLVSSGSNTGSLLTWMQVRNKMWGFNGVDSVKTWDKTTLQVLDGTKGTPNVPKFKYGSYWQERVWGFNDPTGASNLSFSALTTTDAIIINPDDSRAWPQTNGLKIGQGDGELGTALWVQGGQLRCGKERSIHTIYGTSVSNYFPRKESSNSIGVVSNESVVNLDGATYYLSQDGIYQDGGISAHSGVYGHEERISDLIEPDIETINKGRVQTISNLWDTQTDFAKGQFSGTTVTANGILQPNTNARRLGFLTNDTFPPPAGGGTVLQPGTTYFGWLRMDFVQNVSSSEIVYVSRVRTSLTLPVTDNGITLRLTLRNMRTGESHHMIQNVKASGGDIWTSTSMSPLFSGFDINQGSFGVKLEVFSSTYGFENGNINIDNLDSVNWNFDLSPATTGQFISDIATNTSITAWGIFDSINSPNGGSVNFYERTSTSVVNITTQTWKPIVPGAFISEPTQNRFIQWASTITSVSSFTNISNIDQVLISHVEGAGSLNRAFGIGWKNRYWLATSTITDNTLSLIYVKSKITNENPNSWMPIEGINIRSLAQNNGILYAGSSSTGSVYRLDYGSDFDGSAIRFCYDTPDMPLKDYFASKNIQNYLLDADKDISLSLSVGTSIDMGAFNFRTIPLTGSTRSLTVIKGVTSPIKTLRIRLTHSILDNKFSVNNLTVNYIPTSIIEPK